MSALVSRPARAPRRALLLRALALAGPLFMLALGPLSAQQNLFNIPSGAITPKRELFYQHQLNLYSHNRIASKQHVVVGTGRGWEFGFNLVNFSFDLRRPGGRLIQRNDVLNGQSLKPKVHLTAQKQWRFSDRWAFSLGTQNGMNLLAEPQNTRYAFFHYGLAVWTPKHHTRLVAGPYVGNRAYLGGGNDAGFIIGYEYPMPGVKNLLLMGDYISGTNQESVAVIGVNYYITPRFQLCLGGIVASPGSGNEGGVVFEVNLLTYDDD